jgi:hypothetical protein
MRNWHTGLPDSDVTVLMLLQNEEYPIWVGFHDGESWRTADTSTVDGPVLGWLHLEEAVELLDRPEPIVALIPSDTPPKPVKGHIAVLCASAPLR